MVTVLVVIRENKLLVDKDACAEAGLVVALVVQMVLLAQNTILFASFSSISFHAFVGRTSSLMPVLTQGEVRFGQSAKTLSDSASGWELCNVVVSHSPSVPAALDLMSITVETGQRVLMLGRRGSGIETLPLALLRAVKLQHGKVLIGGNDIAHLSVKLVRDYIKFVPRRPIMFEGSILGNLWQPYRIQDPSNPNDDGWHVPKNDILTVLKFVGLIARTVSVLPEEMLNAPIHDTTIEFRMLLFIARALLQRPVMLVLEDLALSVEAKKLNQLDQMLVAQQHLSVVHTSTVAARLHCFERIVVMDNGAVVQDGSPQSLVTQPGLLSDMLLETGPVNDNRMRIRLGAPARELPSATAPITSGALENDGMDFASTVGFLGPISEMEAEDTPEKSEAAAAAAAAARQRPSVFAPVDPAIADKLKKLHFATTSTLIQSCVMKLHEMLLLDFKTGQPRLVQQARTKIFLAELPPKLVKETEQVGMPLAERKLRACPSCPLCSISQLCVGREWKRVGTCD